MKISSSTNHLNWVLVAGLACSISACDSDDLLDSESSSAGSSGSEETEEESSSTKESTGASSTTDSSESTTDNSTTGSDETTSETSTATGSDETTSETSTATGSSDSTSTTGTTGSEETASSTTEDDETASSSTTNDETSGTETDEVTTATDTSTSGEDSTSTTTGSEDTTTTGSDEETTSDTTGSDDLDCSGWQPFAHDNVWNMQVQVTYRNRDVSKYLWDYVVSEEASPSPLVSELKYNAGMTQYDWDLSYLAGRVPPLNYLVRQGEVSWNTTTVEFEQEHGRVLASQIVWFPKKANWQVLECQKNRGFVAEYKHIYTDVSSDPPKDPHILTFELSATIKN